MSYVVKLLSSLVAATSLLVPVTHPHPPAVAPAAISPAAVVLAPRITTTSTTPVATPHLFPLVTTSPSDANASARSASLRTSNQSGYITQEELTAQIEQVSNSLRSLIYQNQSEQNSDYATGGYTNDIALTNRIDNLSGSSNGPLTISDATLSNVSGLTAAEIPALNYFTASSTISIAYGGTGTSTAPAANELLLSDANGNWEYVSTSTLGIEPGGIAALGPAGQTQTGSTQILATSSDTNIGLTITASGNTQTFTSQWLGTLAVNRGGTGSTTLSGLLIGNGTGALQSASLAGGLSLSGNTLTDTNVSSQWTTNSSSIYYNSGSVGIGTTSPGSLLSIGTTNGINLSTGSSTFNSTGGINLTAGCFAINGTCLPEGGPFAALTVPTAGASFTGSISGNVLTVSAVASGTLYPGQQVIGAGIISTTTIYVIGTGTGGTGTYTLSTHDGTVASEAMTSVSPDVFIGPNAGNTTTGGTADMAIGFNAGASLTIPASPATANPQNDTFFGYLAGQAVTTARETTLIGADAGASLVGNGTGVEDSLDTFVGSFAGTNCINCTDNTFLGQKAGANGTSSSEDVAIGAHGGIGIATGTDIVAIGAHTIDGASVSLGGSFDDVMGYNAGEFLDGNAEHDDFVGSFSGYGTSGTHNTASNNVGVGYDSLNSITTAAQNVAIGSEAGLDISSTGGETFVGYQAGEDVTGYNVTAIGNGAAQSITTGGFDIFLGANAGDTAPSNATNMFVVGSGASSGQEKISDAYFGEGYVSASPTSFTLHATGGSGSNVAGANVTIAGGQGTGSANGGSIFFDTSQAAASSTSLDALAADMAITSSGLVGIGTTTPYSRLTVWGPDTAAGTAALTISNSASTTELQVFDSGNATLAGTLTQNSDQRLKTNVQSLNTSTSLSLIDALNPVTFNWIEPSEGSGTQVGFIAQQVQQIFPELVSTTSATTLTPGGTLGLNYIGLISPIVSAIQALSGEVQSLVTEVQGLAQSFTSETITATNELCINKSNGAPVCITGDQLAGLLAAEGQQGSSPPAVEISEGSATMSGSGTTTPPTITINGANPAIIQVGSSYVDLGASVSDIGSGQAGNTNLGYQTFLNGTLVSNIVIDTSQVATDTIEYVATDGDGLTATSSRTVLIEATAAASSTAQ